MKRAIGDVELGYDVRGEGPVLVLVHAFPFDRRMWSETAAVLAAGHARRVVTLDLRGFGESAATPAPGTASVADFADDVARLLDALGVPMATLGGLSLGGYVALAFAARHKSRLAGLVLANTRAAADSEIGRAAREATLVQVRAAGPGALLDGVPERSVSRHADADLRARVRELAGGSAAAILAATAAMRDRPDRTRELGAVECPTLVVAGGEDSIAPPSEMRLMAQAIPGAEYVEIAGAGHLSNLEAPAQFDDAVGRFLVAHSL